MVEEKSRRQIYDFEPIRLNKTSVKGEEAQIRHKIFINETFTFSFRSAKFVGFLLQKFGRKFQEYS